MHEDALRIDAELLLRLCEREPATPFYSEAELRRKLRLARLRESLAARTAPVRRPQAGDGLLERECEAVMRRAQLTERQSSVLSMRLEGLTFEQIGCASQSSKQNAQRVFTQAVKKLARSFTSYSYTGLSDVYHREIRRGARTAFGTMPS